MAAAAANGGRGAVTRDAAPARLCQAKATNAALVDVANWLKVLQVVNSLQAIQAGLTELKQVQCNSAIRSKSQ